MAKIFSLFGEVFVDTAAADKSIKDTTAKGNDFNKSLEKIGKTAGDVGKKLALTLTAPIVALGTLSVKTMMEYEATMQQVNRTLGDSADVVKTFAKENALSFNMSQKAAIEYGAVYSNLLASFISDQEENATRTTELLEASAIIASSTGRTMEDVMDRIRSGLLGNTEAIEDLGVNVNVAMLTSTDAFKRFAGDKSWGELDFQTQQQIRLMGILEQTTKKYGDEISENTLSKTQQLNAKFENLKLEVGEKLLPIFVKLLDKVIEITSWFGSLSDGQQTTIINMALLAAGIAPVLLTIGGLIRMFTDLKVILLATNIPLVATVAAVSGLAWGIYEVVTNWDKMTGMEKVASVLGILAVAATGAAIAVGALQSAWTVGAAAAGIAAGVWLITNSINNARKRAEEELANITADTQKQASNGGGRRHRNGLDYVPFDEYPAILHKGEKVLTAKEAQEHTNGQTINNVINVANLQVRTDEDIKRIAEELYYLQLKEAV